MRTFKVNVFRVRSQHVSSDIARYFQYLFVILYRVLVVYGSIFKLLFVCVVFLTKIHHALHERMAEVELKFRMVAIIICHDN